MKSHDELLNKAIEAQTENQNRDLDRVAKERESAIGLASDVVRAPTTETGKQTGVAGAGEKATKIIREVDKGLKPE